MQPVEPARLPRSLPRLTSLRAFAALMVFGYHLSDKAPVLSVFRSIGYTGVGFFFLLSGFVLTWSSRPDDSNSYFWWRRFARIYPAFILATFFGALISSDTRTVKGFVVTVLMLQAWFPKASIAYSFDGVTWSLSCEAFFYMLLPLILPRVQAMSSRSRWAIALTYGGMCAAVLVFAGYHGGTFAQGAFTDPLVRLGGFLLGVVLALEIRSGWRLSIRYAAAMAALGVGLTYLFRNVKPGGDASTTFVWFALIASCAQFDIARARGWLTTRTLVYAGTISYCFYLFHGLILIEIGDITGRHHTITTGIYALLLSCIASAAAYHLVEHPAQNFLLRVGNHPRLQARLGREDA